jgi:outer membrane lipoprotein-sorting protein
MTRALTVILLSLAFLSKAFAAPDPVEIVRAAIDNWRGKSSFVEQTMTVHRPEWERTSSMVSFTRGRKDALVRFTGPPRDEGNATLTLDNDMWVFTPRLNQVIKLPASMMVQPWMGSDFSYDDLAKTDQLLVDYDLSVVQTGTVDAHKEYVIDAKPHPDAPIVWGKEVLRIRDDHVLLERAYYDQGGKLVKRMVSERVAPLDGRPYPYELRMIDAEDKDHWTLVVTKGGRFDIDAPDYLFTLSNLRNPRNWKP